MQKKSSIRKREKRLNKVKIEKGMLKKFVTYYRPYKKLFFLDLLVATISALCDLVYPMITRNVVNRVIPNKEFRFIAIFAIVLMVIYFIKMMCAYWMQYWTFGWSRYASRYEKRCL